MPPPSGRFLFPPVAPSGHALNRVVDDGSRHPTGFRRGLVGGRDRHASVGHACHASVGRACHAFVGRPRDASVGGCTRRVRGAPTRRVRGARPRKPLAEATGMTRAITIGDLLPHSAEYHSAATCRCRVALCTPPTSGHLLPPRQPRRPRPSRVRQWAMLRASSASWYSRSHASRGRVGSGRKGSSGRPFAASARNAARSAARASG